MRKIRAENCPGAAGLAEGAASSVFSEVSVSKLFFLEGIFAVLVTRTCETGMVVGLLLVFLMFHFYLFSV